MGPVSRLDRFLQKSFVQFVRRKISKGVTGVATLFLQRGSLREDPTLRPSAHPHVGIPPGHRPQEKERRMPPNAVASGMRLSVYRLSMAREGTSVSNEKICGAEQRTILSLTLFLVRALRHEREFLILV